MEHDCDTTDTVVVVKQKHAEKTGVDQSVIILSFNGQGCNDTDNLTVIRKVSPVGGNELDFVASEKMKINIDMWSGDKKVLDMKSTDVMADVKQRLSDETKVEKHIIELFFNDKEQHDDKNLETLKLEAGVNQIDLRAKEREEITVQMMTGTTVPLEMEMQQTILDVKSKLQASQGLAPEKMKILFNGAEMTDV